MVHWCDMRVRWWLAAACVLAAFVVAQEDARPQCRKFTFPNCRPTQDPEVFRIYGGNFRISYLNGGTMNITCVSTPLDSNVIPAFTKRVYYEKIILKDCTKNSRTYRIVFRGMNISAPHTLIVLNEDSSLITKNAAKDTPDAAAY